MIFVDNFPLNARLDAFLVVFFLFRVFVSIFRSFCFSLKLYLYSRIDHSLEHFLTAFRAFQSGPY